MEHEEAAQRFDIAVGQQLNTVRRARGMTYDGIADATPGVSRSAISRYFSGSRTVPLDVLAALCVTLGVEPADIVARAWAKSGYAETAPAAESVSEVTYIPIAAKRAPSRGVDARRAQDESAENGGA